MLVFVGTYTEPITFGTGQVLQGKGEGIHAYWFDELTGALRPLATASGVANPSYLALDASLSFLYAVNELKSYAGEPTGTVSAFRVDAATGRLRFLNRQATHGTDPCHVAVNHARTHVFVANFMSGSVCVLPVRRDGSLSEACDLVQHHGSSVDPRRQAGPHAHSVTLDASDRIALVPDLGLDQVMIYRFDPNRGKLDPNAQPSLAAKPGSGPRHLAFHPNGRFAYLVNELDSTVEALAYVGEAGSLRHVQTVSTLPVAPPAASTCADIHVHPSGRFVYASNRGHDSIAAYRVDPTSGALSVVRHESTRGRTPRSFAIDPTGRFLIVANQDTDSLVPFRIDPDTGVLRSSGETTWAPTPVCIRFFAEE